MTTNLAFDRETGLTEKESAILNTLPRQEKNLLKDLVDLDPLKHKDKVVSFRFEDIFYFAECLHKARFPTESHLLMSKAAAPTELKDKLFYTLINPESRDLEAYAENRLMYLRRLNDPDYTLDTLFERIKHSYGRIGIKQAVLRNVYPEIVDKDDFKMEVRRMYPHIVSEPLSGEVYFNALSQAIATESDTREIDLLLKHLPSPAFRECTIAFLKTLPARGSIFVGFNDSLCAKYAVSYENEHDLSGAEMVFITENGAIDTSTVFGVKAGGAFEERILKTL